MYDNMSFKYIFIMITMLSVNLWQTGFMWFLWNFVRTDLSASSFNDNEFINELPKDEIPQETKGYEGFFHVTQLSGSIEETHLELIIRDHDARKFKKRKWKAKPIITGIT